MRRRIPEQAKPQCEIVAPAHVPMAPTPSQTLGEVFNTHWSMQLSGPSQERGARIIPALHRETEGNLPLPHTTVRGRAGIRALTFCPIPATMLGTGSLMIGEGRKR